MPAGRIDRWIEQRSPTFAIRYLVARSPLREALATGRSRGWLEAARGLCLERSSPLLKDELLLKILCSSALSNPELEMLLTAIRRILLLELPAKRFADRALVGFAVSLLQQCWSNDFVWFASEEEAQRLAEEPIRPDKLAAGDREEAQRFLRHCLYQPVVETLGGRIDPETAAGIQPRGPARPRDRRVRMRLSRARPPPPGAFDCMRERRKWRALALIHRRSQRHRASREP